MKYDVVWVGTAERRLTQIWLASRFRSVITQAAQAIDKELSNRPFDVGESRGIGQRILLAMPLGVVYELHADKKLVRVLRAREIKRRTV
jgi:hypothetical protein